MIKYITAETASRRLGMSKRGVQRGCKDGAFPGACKRDGRWEIRVTADPRLGEGKSPERTTDEQLSGFSQEKIARAQKRRGMVLELEKEAADRVRNGGTRSDALELYAAEKGATKRTLERWVGRYKEHGLVGLVDMRGGNCFGDETISEEALQNFLRMYLTEQRLSVRLCLRNLEYVNRKQKKDWVIPSLRVMQYYVKKYIPEPVKILHREGLAAYNTQCAAYTQFDPDSVQPGAIWVGDHSQFNCWVRHRNRWIRPWLTAWQDMRSRVLVGWEVCALPNQTTILIAIRRAIERYGPPDMAKVDNGRDFDSEMWTGRTKAQRKRHVVLRAGYLDEQEMAGLYAMLAGDRGVICVAI
ncbi:MAG: DDE-type integrase/transposase/recombinase [Planctomycetes bacterium]|nr:DDE-type integrase/transposase/recombinase [Planctomycetota bacterium]